MNHPNAAIARWLFIVAGMVFVMAVIGAITRLTESGLSMVEWKPLIGVLPPLSEAEWNRVFDLYRQTPEFRVFNSHMELSGFKTIFFWEWFHRLWGHLIAAVFAIPFLVFLVRGRVPDGYKAKLLGLFLLGGLQGVIGWFMVLSGLADRPEVSHYRLALHLGAAVLIYCLLLVTAFGLLDRGVPPRQREAALGLREHGWWALCMIALTMVWGAFVAGLDAGLAYNTFPLMAGHWIPPEVGTLVPGWLNLFENTAAVQLIHRCLAITTALVVLAWSFRVWRADIMGAAVPLALCLGLAVVVQVCLGIATLLTVAWIPLAATHQAGALVVIGLTATLLAALGSKPRL